MSIENRRYATLSHCWSDKLPIRTLGTNLELFRQEIPFDLHHKTFRDAIAITQSLHIPYLWIDALCIVQDDPEEWKVEVMNMRSVYLGSFLNIAACDASRNEEGCFPNLEFKVNDGINLFTIYDNSLDLELAVRIQVGDTREATKNTILSTRGWVLQEQLLSRRMVSCMHSELHWECMKSYRTETGAYFEQIKWNICNVLSFNQEVLKTQQHSIWRSWMKDYSKRNFTYWKDRLPALSGLTQYYQNVTGDVPLLGLWKSSLVEDLLWVRLGQISHESLESLRVIKLPSWSWLSCTSEIGFDVWQITLRTSRVDPYVIVEDHWNLIDYAIEWDSSPFTSVIKAAHLVLEGPTIKMLICVAEDGQQYNPPYLKVEVADVENSQRKVSSICTGQFDHGNYMQPSQYTCLLVRTREHIQTKMRRETFLILEQIASSTENVRYKRFGIACFIGSQYEFKGAIRRELFLI